MTEHQLLLQRYDPEHDDAPRQQRFSVPADHTTSVLDALLYVQQQLDPTLALRWSCRMAICGSCGVMVNGIPKLGCKTFLRDYSSEIVIAPLAHFGIEKDLIVDMTQFLSHLSAIKPYLINDYKDSAPQRQTPAQLSKYQPFSNCINCGLCYAACPQFGLNPEFLGPAAITLAQRYNLDSRDAGKAARMGQLNSKNGAWGCTFVGSCSEVCPKQLDPAAAVNQAKLESAKDFIISWFKP